MTTATYPAEEYIDTAMAEARIKGWLDDECVGCPAKSYLPPTDSSDAEYDCPASLRPGAVGCYKRPEIMENDDIVDRAAHLQEEAEYEDPEDRQEKEGVAA